MLKPTADVPGVHARPTEYVVGAVAVPLRAIVNGELLALLVTTTLPVGLPALVGSKTTVKDVDWPAARASGKLIPVVEKPVPVLATPEIVTLEFPVFVSVTLLDSLVFVVTLPKLTDVGEAESWRTEATLEPDSATTAGELGELLVSERFA